MKIPKHLIKHLFLFDLGNKSAKPTVLESLKYWFRNEFTHQKLNSSFGYILFIVIAFVVSLFVHKGGLNFSLGLFAAVVLLPLGIGAMLHLRFGIYLILAISFFLMGVKRLFPEEPIGAVLDSLLILMVFGLFLKQVRIKDWRFTWNPISFAILLWAGYNLFQLANPWAMSTMAWFHAGRSTVGIMFLFFIGLYAFKEIRHVVNWLGFWIGLAVVGALYGLFQEINGLSSLESEWLMASYTRFSQIYSMNLVRKFSFFSSPGTFGLTMGISALACLVMLFQPTIRKWIKVFLGLGAIFLILAMFYSGTRTAFVILPAGFFFFAMITFNKKAMIALIPGAAILLTLVFIPTENPQLMRLQSAFQPGEAVSYKARMENLAYIQHHIQTHPIGSGLGSTGVLAQKYTPETLLSQFPPDSGFVRIAVETGWIGLLFYLGMILTIMIVGVKNYFSIKNPSIKIYQAISLSIIFALIIANYTQPAILELPILVIFMTITVFLAKLKEFDTSTPKKPAVVEAAAWD